MHIPDDDPAGVNSVIKVGNKGNAEDIVVKVNIEHTYIGDLRVEFAAPSGRSATLHLHTGGSQANLNVAYDSKSNEELSSLLGEPLEGDWTIRIQDRAAVDTGTLKEWSLRIAH